MNFLIPVCAVTFFPDVQSKQQDTIVAAWCIYQEARGEPMEGKKAVASVIVNRSGIKGYTVTQTVFKPHAFAGVGPGVPLWFMSDEDAKKQLAPADYDAREECFWIAEAIGKGEFKPTGPWTHFYAAGSPVPGWAMGIAGKKRIGNHMFLKTEF